MSAPKWAAGPWEVGDLDRNEQRTVMAPDFLVAVCPHSCVGSLVPIMEANAHLIAAAPDLYHALEDLQKAVVANDLWHGLEDELSAASAALAKARGEK